MSQFILQPFFCFSYVTSSSLSSPGKLTMLIIDIFPLVCEDWALLIFQPFHHFTYITTHSPTLPSLYLHHSSFSSPSITSPTSPFILQPFFHFYYVTSSSLNSPGEPPMISSAACRLSGWLLPLSTVVGIHQWDACVKKLTTHMKK